MHALEASVRSGSLVVRKRCVGDVNVSTNPPVLVSTTAPVVVAVGAEAVKAAIEKSNVAALVRDGMLEVLL